MVQIGDRFGRLEVVERAGSKEYWSKTENRMKKATLWRCRCDCGNEIVRTTSALRCMKSCGCLVHDVLVERNTSHGLTNTRLYRIYNKMKERCYYEKSNNYHRYGGRGIRICDEWLDDFKNFYDWAIANGYSDDLTIDRIDPDENYSPDNCRWATYKEQNLNKRNTVYVTVNGQRKPLKKWAELTGLSYNRVLDWLLNDGEETTSLRIEEALNGRDFSSPLNVKSIEFNGKFYATQKSLAEAYNIDHKLLSDRLKRGWSLEDALELNPHICTTHKKDGKCAGEVVAINGVGEIINCSCVKELAQKLGVDRSSISHAIRGDYKVRGYQVFWKTDYEGR